jgi:hypothetical protein
MHFIKKSNPRKSLILKLTLDKTINIEIIIIEFMLRKERKENDVVCV